MELSTYYSDPANENFELPPEILAEHRRFQEYMDGNNAKAAIARKTAPPRKTPKPKKKRGPQRRAKSTPQMKWLRSLICPFVYGDATPVGTRPSVNKDMFAWCWNRKLGLPNLPNYKLLDHFQGIGTAYFMGQGWSKADYTLVMIDIDVLKARCLGSPEGALKFAEHLKSIWPDLYYERSTGGKGIHAYLILRKRNCDAKRTNAALKRLEAWLREEAKRVNADIELVEIKGTCLDLNLDGKKVQSIKYGSLAKLPRDVNRFSEWESTTTLRVQDLESSTYDIHQLPHEDIAQVGKARVAALLPSDVGNAAPSLREDIAHEDISEGSTTGKFITKEQLSRIPHYEKLYRQWVGPNDLMAGKFRVTAHDFAVALMLLQHVKADANHDESLPVRRVEKLWTALFHANDIQRGFCHHRWKRIRDFLSAKGHIHWIDNRYEHPNMVKNEKGKWCRKKDSKGKESVGVACKWGISEGLDNWLNQIATSKTHNTGEASFVDTKSRKFVPSDGKGKNLRPIRASVRAIRLWVAFDRACELMIAA